MNYQPDHYKILLQHDEVAQYLLWEHHTPHEELESLLESTLLEHLPFQSENESE
ncbi:MAG: hypothetical protein AABY00_00950 [Nanoarchaeota archaeon]